MTDWIIIGLIILNVLLVCWALCLDTKVEQLQGYIERMNRYAGIDRGDWKP